MMNSGHTLNIESPCNLGISCNNNIFDLRAILGYLRPCFQGVHGLK